MGLTTDDTDPTAKTDPTGSSSVESCNPWSNLSKRLTLAGRWGVIKCGCAERGCRLKPAFHCGRNAGFSRQLRTHFQSRPEGWANRKQSLNRPATLLECRSK